MAENEGKYLAFDKSLAPNGEVRLSQAKNYPITFLKNAFSFKH